MTSFIFNSALELMLRGKIDFEDDDFKVMLCTAGYRPSKHHTTRGDVMAYEVTGTGYGVGGLPVSVAVVQDRQSNGTAVWLGGASWSNATFKAHYGIYYRRVGGELIACIDFGDDVRAVKGPFSITASEIVFG